MRVFFFLRYTVFMTQLEKTSALTVLQQYTPSPAACFIVVGGISLYSFLQAQVNTTIMDPIKWKERSIHKFIGFAAGSLTFTFLLPTLPLLTTLSKVIFLSVLIFNFSRYVLLKIERGKRFSPLQKEIYSRPNGDVSARRAMVIYDAISKVELFILLNVTATAIHFLKRSVAASKEEKGVPLAIVTILYLAVFLALPFFKLDKIEEKYFLDDES
ncbi:hypothetical protein K0U07_01220 [bacterium]|nr:hypothetical protein [bacterium]